MITLEKEFIKNVDHCGDHKFIQIKREDDYAAYIRYKLNGDVFGYEFFKIKIVKAGTKLPNNVLVEEDYEVYPSKHQFGKTAIFFSNKKETNINRAFETFVRTFKPQIDSEKNNTLNEINLPNELFSTKTLMALNPTKTYLDCYQYIKSEENKSIIFVESVPNVKGKPTNFYKKING